MKISNLFLIIICGLIFLTACNRNFSTNGPDNLPRAVSDLENTMVQSNNAFGFNLMQETAASEAYGNLCISPLSVSFALGMAYNGSATVTETAMRSTLDYGNMTEAEINSTYQSLIDLLHNLDQSVIMNIANSAWCRDNFPFKEEFITVLQTYFDAEVQNLDFSDPAAVDIINGWVDTKTNGKIDEIIDSIPAEAVLYLINALYFKADWTTKFDPDETAEAPFYLADGTTKNCSMMNLMSSFPYFENDTFKAVSLPYGNEQYSMTILLPKPGRTTAEAIDLLTPQNWTSWISSLASHEITIQLPKFTLEYEIELKNVLTTLGMGNAFTDQADFSKMSTAADLFISKVKHKTYIQVDEEGTEAAAVTAVEVSLTSSGQYMVINRPFIFLIHDHHTGTLLFTGIMADPEV